MIDDIINRMIKAAGVKNASKLAEFIEKDRSTISGWRARGSVPDDMINIVALKTGVRADWLKTGDPPERAAPLFQIREQQPDFIPGLQYDGAPLTRREQNEITIMRWLDQHHPDIRNRLSDEIVEMFRLAVFEKNGGGES